MQTRIFHRISFLKYKFVFKQEIVNSKFKLAGDKSFIEHMTTPVYPLIHKITQLF